MGHPRFEVLDWVDTEFGVLCLRRRAVLSQSGTFVTEVTLANEPLMSSLHTVSEEALATESLSWNVGAKRVLVGGLGLGYTAWAALQDSAVEMVRVIEHLPEVIGWLQDGKIPLSETLSNDERFSVVRGDVYGQLLAAPESTWDAILIDVDHSPSEPLGEPSRHFHTEAGVRAAGRHLAPGGVLAVWSAEADDAFAACMATVFSESRVVEVPWENQLNDGDREVDVLFLGRG